MAEEFQRIDSYCDTVPRSSATTEHICPFTLFVGLSGRSFYARPTVGLSLTTPPERADFDRVLARQRIPGTAVPMRGGSHSPRGDVTEIAGVGTLPAHRRRGLGAAVTHALAADAAVRGVDLCFLTAGSIEPG